MNYLARSVFLFAADWVQPVARPVSFNLRPQDIGYGETFFTPTANWTVNSWKFSLTLETPQNIADVDAFFDALVGRLQGFWLPIPFNAAEISAGTSTTVFKIKLQNFSDYWNARPDKHLFFTFADGTQAAAQIQGVVNNGDGTETVTLTGALPQIPNAQSTVQKLHYVRLADDNESGSFVGEGIMAPREISVVELPEEYAAAETGQKPIFLFHFYTKAPMNVEWFYTSFAAPVVSAGKIYKNYPIDFENCAQSSDGSADDLKITAKADATHPFSLFMPTPFSGTLYVDVMVCDYTTPDNQTKLFAGGRVTVVEDQATKYQATCESRLGLLKRRLPRFTKSRTCNNILFDQNTCRVDRAIYETTGVIVSIDNDLPPTVTCTFLIPALTEKFQADNYFQNGLLESDIGLNYEARSILASSYDAGTGQLTLTLNLPLLKAQAGGHIQIVAGCNHLYDDPNGCPKFANQQNFSGFLAIPDRNPVLKSLNQTSAGGKK